VVGGGPCRHDGSASVARLASDGRTKLEIGALLFLSPRTIEWHLGHVFSKLGVASRRDLRTVLPRTVHTAVAG